MLGKILATTCIVAVLSIGVGASSYAPSVDKKARRPQTTETKVGMPAEQLPIPPGKAKPLALIGQSSPQKNASDKNAPARMATR
ncbi:MAG: hypothetical protein JWM77_3704 [Rhodospirillales bacterium]|nr:hypothetical protein [Rhodospirillales bacterium]